MMNESDPTVHDDKFLKSPAFSPNNDLKYEVTKKSINNGTIPMNYSNVLLFSQN